jgi:hypothetical protein
VDKRKDELRTRFANLLSKAPVKRSRYRKVPGYESPLDIEAQKLWQTRFSRTNRLDALETWWDCVPEPLRSVIDKAIRPFFYVQHLRYAELHRNSGLASYSLTAGASLWAGLQDQLPKVTREQFMLLLRSSAKERGQFAQDFGKRTTAVLKRFLRVRAHRVRKNFDRDWQLAKWVYEEMSTTPSAVHFKKACRQWKQSHPESPTLTPAVVKTAIARVHDEFLLDQYERRLFTYVENFPTIGLLTCPECKGKCEIPNPDPIWRDWYTWQERDADSVSKGIHDVARDPEPQPQGNGSIGCPNCAGTGRKSPKTSQNE